jgi:hypothetical protein
VLPPTSSACWLTLRGRSTLSEGAAAAAGFLVDQVPRVVAVRNRRCPFKYPPYTLGMGGWHMDRDSCCGAGPAAYLYVATVPFELQRACDVPPLEPAPVAPARDCRQRDDCVVLSLPLRSCRSCSVHSPVRPASPLSDFAPWERQQIPLCRGV